MSTATTVFDPFVVPVPKRRCGGCNAILAQWNKSTLCAPCQERADRARKARTLFVGRYRLGDGPVQCGEPGCNKLSYSVTGLCAEHRPIFIAKRKVFGADHYAFRAKVECSVMNCHKLTRSKYGRCKHHMNIKLGTPLKDGTFCTVTLARESAQRSKA